MSGLRVGVMQDLNVVRTAASDAEVIEQIAEFRDHGLRHVVVGNAGAIQPSLRKSAAMTAPYIKVVRGLRKL